MLKNIYLKKMNMQIIIIKFLLRVIEPKLLSHEYI